MNFLSDIPIRKGDKVRDGIKFKKKKNRSVQNGFSHRLILKSLFVTNF